MPDLCGAFLHDIDLAIELQKRGHSITFLTTERPKEGYNGGVYRGFRFMHYTAAGALMESSQLWICPHAPALPHVRKINSRGYHRPIVATAHFDGRYSVVTDLASSKWVEMFLFINHTMEANFRRNAAFPSSIVRTGTVRPLMHESKIKIDEPPNGDAITLVNANINKGVNQFIDLAKRMPTRKFLAVRPYYGELWIPAAPSNVEWIPFDDDIRAVLKRTRILLLPSKYESFGRIAVEAMYNGIPVIYSKPATDNVDPVGTTEGVEEWIVPAGIACKRDAIDEWVSAIERLDDAASYEAQKTLVRDHILGMNIFSEAGRIADMMEEFQREHPIVVTEQARVQPTTTDPTALPRPPPTTARIGFSSGRLRLQR
jgi:glycosyltransferase involved in cell wall biosynthesis